MAQVGCEQRDGLLKIHEDSEHCDVCRPIAVPYAVLVRIIERIIEYRQPQVCKHLVALDIVNLLHDTSVLSFSTPLIQAISDGDDEQALALIQEMY